MENGCLGLMWEPVVRAEVRFGIVCFLAYVAIAWAIRFDTPMGPRNRSIIFPFDTFSMYSDTQKGKISSIIFVDENESVTQAKDYRIIECQNQAQLAGISCLGTDGISYLLRDIQNHIRRASGKGTVQLQLVQRIWTVQPLGPTTYVNDCLIDTCLVSP